MSSSWPADGHPGDFLSALADGELVADERAAVEAHVAACGSCGAELAEVERVRVAVSGLPPVEPPEGFVASLLPGGAREPRWAEVVPLPRRRWAAAHVAASVAASVLLLVSGVGFGEDLPGLAPAVSDAFDTHATAMSVVEVLPSRQPSGDVAAPYRAPERLPGGYRLAALMTRRRGLQLVYENDRWGISVFEEPGRMDWGALPAGGQRISVDGDDAWLLTAPHGSAVVIQRGDLVHTVVGDGPPDHVLQAARALPGPRSLSLLQRLRQACAGVLEDLSVVGAT